jgi:hypothetical protein
VCAGLRGVGNEECSVERGLQLASKALHVAGSADVSPLELSTKTA